MEKKGAWSVPRAKKQLGGGEHAGEKWRGEWENVRNSVLQFGTGTKNAGGARACFPNGKGKLFLLSLKL